MEPKHEFPDEGDGAPTAHGGGPSGRSPAGGPGDYGSEMRPAVRGRGLQLEDIELGTRVALGASAVGAGELSAFASAYDPQPMHADPEAAARGPFGGLIASGWLTVSLAMRMICDAAPLGSTPILGTGVDELRWPNPVRPGDTLSGYIEFVEARLSASRTDRGIVRLPVVLDNQRGETVLTMLPSVVVPAGAQTGDVGPNR